MGLTREQLMAGVTTVNGEDYERKESEARKAARIKRAEGGGVQREASTPGVPAGGTPDVPANVQDNQASPEDYLKSLLDNRKARLEKNQTDIDFLINERRKLRANVKQLEAALTAWRLSSREVHSDVGEAVPSSEAGKG